MAGLTEGRAPGNGLFGDLQERSRQVEKTQPRPHPLVTEAPTPERMFETLVARTPGLGLWGGPLHRGGNGAGKRLGLCIGELRAVDFAKRDSVIKRDPPLVGGVQPDHKVSHTTDLLIFAPRHLCNRYLAEHRNVPPPAQTSLGRCSLARVWPVQSSPFPAQQWLPC